MTILYYLSDVDVGGETAFPLAGQNKITDSVLDDKVSFTSNVNTFYIFKRISVRVS